MFFEKRRKLNKELIETVESEARLLIRSQVENRVVLERSRDNLYSSF